jgi:mono/diheme cytochrome c family protein
MSAYQVTRSVLKWLIVAGTIIGFSTFAIAQDIDFGKMDYESSCGSCHGKEGKGDGPLSEELRTKPPNLTVLAKNNDGVFPGEVLYQIIDGRKTIRAHGSFEMPVWGYVFLNFGPDYIARNRISAIINYLKSIQVK